MKPEFNFVEIASLDESLCLTPWERILKNDQMVNRLLEIEAFIERLQRGWKLIQLHHGNTR
jgi:hypothetical protein